MINFYSDVYLNEPNPYRAQAIKDVTDGVEVKYEERYILEYLSWNSMAFFTWNIDRALGRDMVHLKKDEIWVASELIDDECKNNPIEMSGVRRQQDKALLSRLFALNRIKRRLHDQY